MRQRLPSTTATTSNVRSCGGPSSETISYVTIVPRRANRSWSADLKSAGRASASSISGLNASTTASNTAS